MFEYTKNNYMWGEHKFKNNLHDWDLTIGQTTYSPGNYKSECIKTAKYLYDIVKKLPPPSDELYVFYSGGIDSEIMTLSFMEADVPFKLVVVRYNDNINDHELYWVDRFITKHNLPVIYYDVNLYEFVSSGIAYSYDKVCDGGLLLWNAIIHTAKNVPGVPIIGGSTEIRIRTFEALDKDKWYFLESERGHVYSSYFANILKCGTASFLRYSPEQLLSYLENPIVQKLSLMPPNEAKPEYLDVMPKYTNIPNVHASSLTLKHDIYAQWFDIERRPTYTGFEKFYPKDNEPHCDMYLKMLDYGQRHKMYHTMVFIEYNEMVSYLKGDILSFSFDKWQGYG